MTPLVSPDSDPEINPALDPALNPDAPPPEPAFPFWTYGDLLLFVGLAILALILSQLAVLGASKMLHLPATSQEVLAIPAQFLAYGLIFGVLYALFHLHYGQPMMASLGWNRSGMKAIAALALGFGLSFLIALLGGLLRIPNTDTPMKHLMANPTGLLLIGLFATTLGPLCEELIFRGFLQPLLVRSFGAAPGILLTAVPFGLLHLQQYGNAWQSGVLITFAGAVFGMVRHVTNSTRASTSVHAAYNSTLFLALLFSGRTLPLKW